MGIRLDHAIVPSRDRKAAAALLAGILGVPWSEDTGAGPFSPVYVNEEFTLDVAQFGEAFQAHHFCFKVTEAQFDAILARLREKRILYRSTPLGPADGHIGSQGSGRNVYWGEPDGHVWEILTVSYARRPDD